MSKNIEPVSWELLWATTKFWAWWIVSKFCLGIVCIGIIAEGLRLFVPALGQKLYRLPFLGFLKNYQETYSLDIAPFLALFFMGAVWYFVEKLIQIAVIPHRGEAYDEADIGADVGMSAATPAEAKLIFVLAAVLVGMDVTLFYAAAASMTWGGSLFSIPAFLATAGYLAVLVFVSYVSVKLHREIEMFDRRRAKREMAQQSLDPERRAYLPNRAISLTSKGEQECETTQKI